MTRGLDEIRSDLHTQDNRITHLPLFAVEKRRRIYGLSDEYAEDYIWVDDDSEEADDEQAEELERRRAAGEYEIDGWRRVYYIDIWEFVTACFTEAGCQAYLRANGHNLGPTRIYVHSGYRNEEWKTVRDHLYGSEDGP